MGEEGVPQGTYSPGHFRMGGRRYTKVPSPQLGQDGGGVPQGTYPRPGQDTGVHQGTYPLPGQDGERGYPKVPTSLSRSEFTQEDFLVIMTGKFGGKCYVIL